MNARTDERAYQCLLVWEPGAPFCLPAAASSSSIKQQHQASSIKHQHQHQEAASCSSINACLLFSSSVLCGIQDFLAQDSDAGYGSEVSRNPVSKWLPYVGSDCWYFLSMHTLFCRQAVDMLLWGWVVVPSQNARSRTYMHTHTHSHTHIHTHTRACVQKMGDLQSIIATCLPPSTPTCHYLSSPGPCYSVCVTFPLSLGVQVHLPRPRLLLFIHAIVVSCFNYQLGMPILIAIARVRNLRGG